MVSPVFVLFNYEQCGVFGHWHKRALLAGILVSELKYVQNKINSGSSQAVWQCDGRGGEYIES